MVSTGNPVSCPRCLTSAHRARRTCAPSPLSAFLQDHGIFAWRNQFGTFQVKNEQNKTKTSTKFQKTKTTKTEQKTTDKLPTAGQRVVHFRALAYALAIISVAAACGLSVPAPALHIRTALVHTAVRRATLGCLQQSSGRAASPPPARLCVPTWAPH